MDLFRIRTVEMHTAGEPLRIVSEGYPRLEGATLLDKRREARDRHDLIRRRLMHEPRGHAGMYGAVVTDPDDPHADLAVLFMHNEGYSTMCGHGVIALARWALDSGMLAIEAPETRVRIQCPCGLVETMVEVRDGRPGRVRFASVPAFAVALDRAVEVAGHGRVMLDIAYGGAFYAVLPAERLGLDVRASPVRSLVDGGEAVAEAVRASVPLAHPEDPELAFLYGAILTDDRPGTADAPSRNVTIFAGRQIDRSPCGSGVTAQIALAAKRGGLAAGEVRVFESLTGCRFQGRLLSEPGDAAVTVEVAGESHYLGESVFTIEDSDPLRDGFVLDT